MGSGRDDNTSFFLVDRVRGENSTRHHGKKTISELKLSHRASVAGLKLWIKLFFVISNWVEESIMFGLVEGFTRREQALAIRLLATADNRLPLTLSEGFVSLFHDLFQLMRHDSIMVSQTYLVVPEESHEKCSLVKLVRHDFKKVTLLIHHLFRRLFPLLLACKRCNSTWRGV